LSRQKDITQTKRPDRSLEHVFGKHLFSCHMCEGWILCEAICYRWSVSGWYFIRHWRSAL